MREVERACFVCKYNSDMNIFIKPENPGLGKIFGGTDDTVLEYCDDPCEICERDESIRKV